MDTKVNKACSYSQRVHCVVKEMNEPKETVNVERTAMEANTGTDCEGGKLKEENILVSALRHKENPKNLRRDTSWLWLTQETQSRHDSLAAPDTKSYQTRGRAFSTARGERAFIL